MIQEENIVLRLFGDVTLKYDIENEDLVEKIKKCLLLLDKSNARFTNPERSIFSKVAEIHLLSQAGKKSFQARALTDRNTIEFNPHAIAKNKTVGLIWLISHEAYHLWDPYVKVHGIQRREGNANLFANKIKAMLEKEPAIYKWGQL